MIVREGCKSVMQIDVITAEIIDAIFNHPNISSTELDFGRYEFDRPIHIPAGHVR
ncbi:MAG: hypothetical protein JWM30_690 [Burkholderia sp.]|jgi:hypothetical protein|nr:hypothetical protein [Burkholderia sp.]